MCTWSLVLICFMVLLLPTTSLWLLAFSRCIVTGYMFCVLVQLLQHQQQVASSSPQLGEPAVSSPRGAPLSNGCEGPLEDHSRRPVVSAENKELAAPPAGGFASAAAPAADLELQGDCGVSPK